MCAISGMLAICDTGNGKFRATTGRETGLVSELLSWRLAHQLGMALDAKAVGNSPTRSGFARARVGDLLRNAWRWLAVASRISANAKQAARPSAASIVPSHAASQAGARRDESDQAHVRSRQQARTARPARVLHSRRSAD